MTYSVKEMFLTLQGEGARTGRPAVFCRFTGCNLWSGLERDRATAQCRFCDTDFVGTDGINGGKFATAEDLATAINALWQPSHQKKYVVFTGGEPCLQLDTPLLDALHNYGFEIAIETNGTLPVPKEVDWICVSPKPRATLTQTKGHELKFVYPQSELNPEDYADFTFNHFFLQPMDAFNPATNHTNTQAAISYCLAYPQWRLSLQTHKILGIN